MCDILMLHKYCVASADDICRLLRYRVPTVYPDILCIQNGKNKLQQRKLKPNTKNDQCPWKKSWQFMEIDRTSKTGKINKTNYISKRYRYNEERVLKVWEVIF